MSGYSVGSGGRDDGVELLLILVQCITDLHSDLAKLWMRRV